MGYIIPRPPPVDDPSGYRPNKMMIECPYCGQYTKAYDSCDYCGGSAVPLIKRGPNKTEKPKAPQGGKTTK